MDDLKSTLEATGFPVAYHHFAEGEAVDPPFLCYYARSSHNFFADDAVHHPTRPSMSSATTTNTKEPTTDTLSLTASPLANGNVKAKTTAETTPAAYDNWFKTVWQPAELEG